MRLDRGRSIRTATRRERRGRHSAGGRLAAGALASMMVGGFLLGLGGTAEASPVPGIPLTTAKLCTEGGGVVGPGGPDSQLCRGGGDNNDVIISEPAADALVRTNPRPASPRPDTPAPRVTPPPPPPPARPAPPAPAPPARPGAPAPAPPRAPPAPPHR